MKPMAPEEKSSLELRLRNLLLSHEYTRGSTGVLMFFKRAPDGQHMGLIASSSEAPDIKQVMGALFDYVIAASYQLGLEEKETSITERPAE